MKFVVDEWDATQMCDFSGEGGNALIWLAFFDYGVLNRELKKMSVIF